MRLDSVDDLPRIDPMDRSSKESLQGQEAPASILRFTLLASDLPGSVGGPAVTVSLRSGARARRNLQLTLGQLHDST